MNKLQDTSTFFEDERTSSENVIASEEKSIAYEQIINTSNLEFRDNTNFGSLEDATWQEPQALDSTPLRIFGPDLIFPILTFLFSILLIRTDFTNLPR